MNISLKNNKYIKIFLPDPWNHENEVKPKELRNLYELPSMHKIIQTLAL